MKSVINKNDKGQLHGYQEWYLDGVLYLKGFHFNNKNIDYREYLKLGESKKGFKGKLEKYFFI